MKSGLPGNDRDLMDAWRAADLVSKFIQREISAEEQAELDKWKARSLHNQQLFDELTEENNIEKAKEWLADLEKQKEKVLENLKQQIEFTPPRATRLNLWWVAASIMLCILVVTFIYYSRSASISPSDSAVIKSADIAPGTNTAVLQLSDGSRIDLLKQQRGQVGEKEVVKITKNEDGMILYADTGLVADNLYNQLSTPVGGQYMISLPDGSKAWLNAASSLRYPLSFKKNRTVEATGEIYFEVRKDKIPFIVKMNDATVEVLGTHFNINTYNSINTTLLEGSVRLSKGNDVKILRPGEMGLVGKEMSVKKLEYPEDEIAWKNGYFRFNKQNIKEIMAQLARWYKIEVSYEGNFEGITFTATARRDENISTILKNIEKAGHIHFRIEGTMVKVVL